MSPADKSLKRPARRPGAEEKFFCPGTRFAVIPLIIEVIRQEGFSDATGPERKKNHPAPGLRSLRPPLFIELIQDKEGDIEYSQ